MRGGSEADKRQGDGDACEQPGRACDGLPPPAESSTYSNHRPQL